ncbi:MFS transporter [Bacillus paralicheniformis]|uniref:MFS transporter n=1 Tax=Bacillus paralicheniformis TaxID=1648923 RepID=UPI000D811139|nr:MFS transporter [Bacillus paralicheniformis]QSG00823.1 MFS transporter [Bacillus paralicheniformis]
MAGLKKNRALFLTAVASGTMLNPLNSSMISLALHSIQHEFHLSFATVSWLISSFYLASAVAQPVTGKIGDLIGRKKMFLSGLLLVAVSAIGAPLAPAFSVLLIMRLFQSIGSGAIYPSGVGLIRSHIHEKRASALSVLSIFSSAMTAFGPTVGGFLIVLGGWPAIFLVNFPFILFSFLLGMYMFPKDEKKAGLNVRAVIKRLDLTGILLFAGGIVLLLAFLLSLSTGEPRFAEGMFGLVLLLMFVWWELRVSSPFIDIRLLIARRTLTSVYAQFIMLNIFNYCLFFGLPSYFQDEMHLSVQASGLLMLFMSGTSVLISPFVGKWIDHSGETQPVFIGSCIMAAGAILLTLFFVDAPMLWKGIILSLLGVSYGLGNVALQAAMFTASPPDIVGTTSGLFQTCRYLGSIFSSVILGLLFGEEITAGHFQDLGVVMIVVAIGSVLMSFRFIKLMKD